MLWLWRQYLGRRDDFSWVDTLFRKARFPATRITRIPAAANGDSSSTRSDFWRQFPSAFSSSAMPERHRHHDSIERRKLFTITLESCSLSGGSRVHDEVEAAITMRRNMQLLFFDLERNQFHDPRVEDEQQKKSRCNSKRAPKRKLR
jgi:hypothetical protein